MMKKHATRLAALLLALCLTLSLAACGKDSDKGKDKDKDKDGGGTTLSGTVYVPEYIPCDFDVDGIRSGCSDGTYIYMLGSKETPQLFSADGTFLRDLDSDFDYEKEVNEEEGEYINYDYKSLLYRMNVDGSDRQLLEGFTPLEVPEGMEGSSYVQGMSLDSENALWVRETMYCYSYDLPEDFDPETDDRWNYQSEEQQTTLLRKLDSTGAEVDRIDMSSLQEKLGAEDGNVYLQDPIMSADGTLYVQMERYEEVSSDGGAMVTSSSGSGNSIAVLDRDMNLLFTLECPENSWGQVYLLGDGTVAYLGNRQKETPDEEGNIRSERYLQEIDKDAKDWGEEYKIPYNCYQIFPGSDKYFFYYTLNDTVYGYLKDKQEGEKLLSWSEADINSSNLNFFTFLSDGRVVTFTEDWRDGESRYELAILTETDASTLPEKTHLTYACQYLGYDDKNKIIQFNKSSDKYRIDIQDYSQFNTEEDYNAGLTQLNTDIGAGKVPDILSTSGLPLTRYGGAGVLEDLWPYIDNDPELSRDQLMTKPLEATEQDGKLYSLFSNFSIQTVVGAQKVVGDRMTWTLADMNAALADMPEGCAYFGEGDTKDGMLTSVLAQNMDGYIDWATGECDFNNPQFTAMLEFCNSFPLEYDWDNVDWETWEDENTRVMNGKQMLMSTSIYDLQYMILWETVFGGDISFIGFPREDGTVGSTFSTGSGLAMSSTCKDKEAAWEFIRTLLLPQYEDPKEGEELDRWRYRGDFPVNKHDFDLMMKSYMTPRYQKDYETGELILDENGNPVEEEDIWSYGSGLEVRMKAVSQAQYDKFMALYNSITSTYTYDEEIFKIVSEIAAGYFNGDRTAQETASLIQNRVDLYVNELR